jgi:hypothetical protein
MSPIENKYFCGDRSALMQVFDPHSEVQFDVDLHLYKIFCIIQ